MVAARIVIISILAATAVVVVATTAAHCQRSWTLVASDSDTKAEIKGLRKHMPEGFVRVWMRLLDREEGPWREIGRAEYIVNCRDRSHMMMQIVIGNTRPIRITRPRVETYRAGVGPPAIRAICVRGGYP